jgi:Arc/MetJ-type ribon-helix-helix transcriptional regulator
MNIDLTPEQEQIVKDELKAGHFHSIEEVIGRALQALRDKDQGSSGVSSDGAQCDAVREMLAFVDENHVRLDDVSAKELIHQGRRL